MQFNLVKILELITFAKQIRRSNEKEKERSTADNKNLHFRC